MDTFIGILVLAAIILVIYLWRKMMHAAGNKLNQTVMPKTHKQGKELTSETHEYTVKASPADVKQAIMAQITTVETLPLAVTGAVKLAGSNDKMLVYEYGNKVQRAFRYAVTFEPDGDGTEGVYTVTNWVVADGLVAGQKQMKQLNADVETALRRLDPTASIRISQDA